MVAVKHADGLNNLGAPRVLLYRRFKLDLVFDGDEIGTVDEVALALLSHDGVRHAVFTVLLSREGTREPVEF